MVRLYCTVLWSILKKALKILTWKLIQVRHTNDLRGLLLLLYCPPDSNLRHSEPDQRQWSVAGHRLQQSRPPTHARCRPTLPVQDFAPCLQICSVPACDGAPGVCLLCLQATEDVEISDRARHHRQLAYSFESGRISERWEVHHGSVHFFLALVIYGTGQVL